MQFGEDLKNQLVLHCLWVDCTYIYIYIYIYIHTYLFFQMFVNSFFL